MEGKHSLDLTSEEWRVRCELAALYRLIAHFRWTDHIDTHISARVPDFEGRYLINTYGVMFHEMRASDLVVVDHDGDPVNPHAGGAKVNRAGFNIHSAIHAARPDVEYVIHTHTAAGIAVSAQEEGLLPISQHALKFHRRLSYHSYEGISWDGTERERLTSDLGGNMAMVLRNHGLLVVGRNAAEAFNQIYMLERACQAQVFAQAGGAKLRIPPEEVCERVAQQEEEEIVNGTHFLAWEAALRLIESSSSDYRA